MLSSLQNSIAIMNHNSISISISLLFLLPLSSLLPPAASLCKPRNAPFDSLFKTFLPPKNASMSIHPFPSPLPSPSPSSSSSVSSVHKPLRSVFLGSSLNAICSKTNHPDLCVSTVKSLAPTLTSTDPVTVLKLEMEATTFRTRGALSKTNALASNPSLDPMTKSLLQVCAEGYEYALTDLSDAKKALATNDRGATASNLSALFADYGDCSDAYSDLNMESPMKAEEDVLTHLASNCLAIWVMI